MAHPDEIQQAKEHIAGLIELGQQIHKALPYLDNLNHQLDWFSKVYERLEDKRGLLLADIQGPVSEISNWDYSTFQTGFASGSTATMMTASNSVVSLIESSDINSHSLIRDYEKINPVRTQINSILKALLLVNDNLYKEFEEVRDCYTRWKSDYKSNSDLAKDVRTFQEHFNGYLNKLRVPKKDWGKVDVPSKSWNKMVEDIGKKSPESRKAFMIQKKIGEDSWEAMTPILKKTIEISRNRMEEHFKFYIAHVYAVLNLIDETVLNQEH